MKVEVQIRTIAMNFWASLEHQMHYKQFGNEEMPEIVNETDGLCGYDLQY